MKKPWAAFDGQFCFSRHPQDGDKQFALRLYLDRPKTSDDGRPVIARFNRERATALMEAISVQLARQRSETE